MLTEHLFIVANVKNNKVDRFTEPIYISLILNQELEESEGLKNKPKLTGLEKVNIKMLLNKWNY